MLRIRSSLEDCSGTLLTTILVSTSFPYQLRPDVSFGETLPPLTHRHLILSPVCVFRREWLHPPLKVGNMTGLNLSTSSILPGAKIGAEKVIGPHGTPAMKRDVLRLEKRFFFLK